MGNVHAQLLLAPPKSASAHSVSHTGRPYPLKKPSRYAFSAAVAPLGLLKYLESPYLRRQL